jgi:hypothetical protein
MRCARFLPLVYTPFRSLSNIFFRNFHFSPTCLSDSHNFAASWQGHISTLYLHAAMDEVPLAALISSLPSLTSVSLKQNLSHFSLPHAI